MNELTTDEAMEAICKSNFLDNPGPRVYGMLNGSSFHLRGALRHRSGKYRTTASIATKDRRRLKELLPYARAQILGRWTASDYKLYDGFYVPIEWFDTLYLDSKGIMEVTNGS